MAASGHAPTATEYIVHHLTHGSTGKQTSIIDFSIFNLDTIFFSILVASGVLLMLWLAARKVTSGVPGRFQAVSRDAGRVGRGAEQVHRPRRPHFHRAAGPDGFPLGLS